MAEELRITITAKDGASQVFKAVADAAKKVSTELEAAGRDGDQGLDKIERGAKDAAQQVDKIGDSAKRASVSFRDFDFAITAIGAGLTYAGNAALEQQQTIIGLQSAYGDAAQEMIAFADEMANVTIFNDDDILRGERYFATLRNNYDLTISEVQQLMQTTADLASAYGTSFEDASSRITAAIRGEGEAAEFLGLTMNQQAIDRQNLTLTMSNQEAAQFRLNALYQQTGVYQGTAAAVAESEVGTRARLTNAIQDNAQALANFTGPLITQAAGIGMASTGLASMAGAFSKLAPHLRTGATGMAALATSINPVVLGIGALAGAGVIAWNILRDGQEAAQSLEDALIQLGDVATNLRLGYRDQEANWVDEMAIDTEYAIALGKTWLNDMDLMWEMAGTKAEEWGISQQDAVYRLQEAYEVTGDHAVEFAAAIDTVGAAFANSAVDHAALDAALDQLDQQYRSRQITLDEYADAYIDIASNIDEYRVAQEGADESSSAFVASVEKLRGLASPAAAGMDEMASSVARVDAAIRDGTLSTEALNEYISEVDNSMARGNMSAAMYAESMENVDDALLGAEESAWTNVYSNEALADALERTAAAAEAAAEAINEAGRSVGAFASEMVDGVAAAEQAAQSMGTAFGGATATRIEEITARTEELATAMLELSNNADYVSQINLTGLGNDATRAAEGINDAAAALDSVLAIYGQIDAMGQRYAGAVSIVDALFGPDGDPSDAIGPLRELYDAGRIGYEQFTAAVASGIAIQERAASVEMSLNEIRVDQLPLLEQTSQAYADYIDQIAAMPDAQDQAATLGWMDEGMQGRIQQFADLGNQLSELGPVGTAAMQQVVDGIVSTDPVLTAMLENLGLIEETLDASGNKTYTVNMDAVAAMDSTERLIQSIDALTLALGGVPPLHLEVTGEDELTSAEESIYALQSAAAQDMVIEIATRLTSPTGDGTGGPEYTGEPVEIPGRVIDLELPDNMPELLVPAKLDIPVEVWDWQNEGAASTQTVEVSQTGAEETTAALDEVTAAAATIPEAELLNVIVMGAYEGATALETVTAAAAAVPEAELLNVIIMGAYEGAAALNGVTAAAAGIPEAELVSVIVLGAGYAIDQLNAVAAAANDVTMTVTTRYVTSGSPYTGNASVPGGRHGGVMGYATGGVIFEAAEAGPELAYFAGGGVALLGAHGLYSAPEGTYISPNNALNGVNVGGVSVAFNGNFYGSNRDELNQWAARDLIPTITTAIQRAERGQGVR